VATIEFSEIDSMRFIEDEQHFRRPEITTTKTTIPLYTAVGWLGLSRKSSRSLYDRLRAALGGVSSSSTPRDGTALG
jgi:hypothetical protein